MKNKCPQEQQRDEAEAWACARGLTSLLARCPSVSAIFGPLIYGEKLHSERFVVEQKKGRTLLYEAMGILENYWLRDREYVCGDEISYADLAAFHEFVSHVAGKIIPDQVWEGFPKITAWFQRMSARPHAKTVSEWQYETVAKILRGEITGSMFKRRTAVLKGTEVFSGHNNGIPYRTTASTTISSGSRRTARAPHRPRCHGTSLAARLLSRCQDKLLMLLARTIGARSILEVGTLAGYSTIWLARALDEGGKLITLEANAGYAKIALKNIANAGLADRVDLRLGPALDSLPTLAADGPFDLERFPSGLN